MMGNKTIAIVGPTTSGKTDIAARVATEINGALVCTDCLQMYEGCTLGTGRMSDADLEQFSPQLYGFRHPTLDRLYTSQYLKLAFDVRKRLAERQQNVVFEGCHFPYAKALISQSSHAAELPAPQAFVVLPSESVRADHRLRERLRKRFGALLDQGLIDETVHLLDLGYQHTLPLRASVLYQWVVKYVLGECSLDVAQKRCIQKTVGIVHQQRKGFSALGQNHHIIDADNVDSAVDKIMGLIDASLT